MSTIAEEMQASIDTFVTNVTDLAKRMALQALKDALPQASTIPDQSFQAAEKKVMRKVTKQVRKVATKIAKKTVKKVAKATKKARKAAKTERVNKKADANRAYRLREKVKKGDVLKDADANWLKLYENSVV